MSRPRLLDLFCGGGGAAMGYHQSGFDVTGVDQVVQKRYPFTFIEADALEYVEAHGQEFSCIHASPPCQAYSVLKHLATKIHPELIDATRAALQASYKPYVIENVVGAPLRWPLMLCGSMFGLETSCGAQLRRHRLFESNVLLMSPGHCQHGKQVVSIVGDHPHSPANRKANQHAQTISVCGDTPHTPRLWRASQRGMTPRTIMVVGATPRDPARERLKYKTITVTGSTPQQNVEHNRIRETFSIEEARRAMGIDWLGMAGLSQAIPPAYTNWVGLQLLAYLRKATP